MKIIQRQTEYHRITLEDLSKIIDTNRLKTVMRMSKKISPENKLIIGIYTNFENMDIFISSPTRSEIYITYQKYLKHIHIGYVSRFIMPSFQIYWVIYKYFKVAFGKTHVNKYYNCSTKKDRFYDNEKHIKIGVYKSYLVKLLN